MKFTDFKVGDMVVCRKNKCDVRFVEDVNEFGILLVNGVKDLSYEKENLKKFNEDFRLLVEKKHVIKEKFRFYICTPQTSLNKRYLCYSKSVASWYIKDDCINDKESKTVFTEEDAKYIDSTGFLREPAN